MAATEGDMFVRRASDIELICSLEHGAVSIGGAVIHDDLVAGFQFLLAELGIAGDCSTHIDDR